VCNRQVDCAVPPPGGDWPRCPVGRSGGAGGDGHRRHVQRWGQRRRWRAQGLTATRWPPRAAMGRAGVGPAAAMASIAAASNEGKGKRLMPQRWWKQTVPSIYFPQKLWYSYSNKYRHTRDMSFPRGLSERKRRRLQALRPARKRYPSPACAEKVMRTPRPRYRPRERVAP
jgi:hypothetical protein